ncbi:MAG: GntR family transcriptional regulator [Streptosporangiaceae bacterium]
MTDRAPAGRNPRRTRLATYLGTLPTRGGTTDAVTDALREAILDGALPPAAWLREEKLARELTVSRTPVREALRRLEDEGLVVKAAHKGTLVASLSLEDTLALYVVRANLEGLAARLATRRGPPGLVDDLERIHHRMRAAQDRPARLSALNLDFHRQIRLAAGNHYLGRFLTQVEHAVRRLPGTTFDIPGRTTETLDEHDAIIRAINDKDAEAAEQRARHHMNRARDIRIQTLLER